MDPTIEAGASEVKPSVMATRSGEMLHHEKPISFRKCINEYLVTAWARA